VQDLKVVEVFKVLGFEDQDDGTALLFVLDPFGDEVMEQLESAGFRVAEVDRRRAARIVTSI
jgi:hypothetical protein